MNISKKVALITGASKGIGAAVAESLAGAGATVLINYKSDENAAKNLIEEIEKAGGSAKLYKADLTSGEEVSEMFQSIKQDYNKIDIVVGNVGGLLDGEAVDNVETFRKTFELNLFSQVQTVKGALELMKSGKIVLVSSVHGGLGRGEGRVVAYSAAKAALNSYMKNLAKELAPEILVNAVSPGRTATPAWGSPEGEEKDEYGKAHATGKMLEPVQVADAVKFLITQDGMCGEILTIDGGMSIKTLDS